VSAPSADIEAVAAAHRRLAQHIQGLTDDVVRRPSLLPDWTVGHTLTHLARNADSHVRRTEGAMAGVFVEQYPGGRAGREADIEAGASRPADQIRDDVLQTAATLDAIWRQTPEAAWSAVSRDVSGQERQLQELPARRWQEVEVHLVDLDIGVSYRDWSDEFVAAWLPRTRAQIGSKLGPDASLPHLEDPRDELAWLYGRLRRDHLPALPPWG